MKYFFKVLENGRGYLSVYVFVIVHRLRVVVIGLRQNVT